MSLLTSPYTTKDQHKFFKKMQKQFNKRSFYNSNYSEPINLLQKVNDNTDRSQQLIKQAMNDFLDRLRSIIADSHNTRIDYYFILSQMKNTDFFTQVASIIAQDVIQKTNRLQRQNIKSKQEIKRLLQKIRDLQRNQNKIQKNNQILKFNGIKTISQNLYQKAKIMTEQQFIQLCNKAILGDKVIIKKVTQQQLYHKWDQIKIQKIQQKQLIKKIDIFLQKGIKENQFHQLTNLIKQIKSKITDQKSTSQCHSPCCVQINDHDYPKKISKAALVRRSNDSRKMQHVYKNDRSEEYFNRYYRRSEFDMSNITSVQKTKQQQMRRIQDDYRINLKQRKKNGMISSR